MVFKNETDLWSLGIWMWKSGKKNIILSYISAWFTFRNIHT